MNTHQERQGIESTSKSTSTPFSQEPISCLLTAPANVQGTLTAGKAKLSHEARAVVEGLIYPKAFISHGGIKSPQSNTNKSPACPITTKYSLVRIPPRFQVRINQDVWIACPTSHLYLSHEEEISLLYGAVSFQEVRLEVHVEQVTRYAEQSGVGVDGALRHEDRGSELHRSLAPKTKTRALGKCLLQMKELRNVAIRMIDDWFITLAIPPRAR